MGGERSRTAGALLVMVRDLADMTQLELAEAAGTSQAALSAYENGRRQPTVPRLAKLVAAAGFDLRWRVTDLDSASRFAEEAVAAMTDEQRQVWEADQTGMVELNLARARRR